MSGIRTRQQLLAVVAAAAVAVWGGDRLVFTPLTHAWKARASRLAQLRARVERGAQLLSQERSIRDRWKEMRSQSLPAETSAAEGQVLKAFDRWSQASGVSISSIRPQWKRGLDDELLLECHADASGNLPTLVQFLYQIEKDPLAVKVDLVEITARDTEGQQLTLGLQISGLLAGTRQP